MEKAHLRVPKVRKWADLRLKKEKIMDKLMIGRIWNGFSYHLFLLYLHHNKIVKGKIHQHKIGYLGKANFWNEWSREWVVPISERLVRI